MLKLKNTDMAYRYTNTDKWSDKWLEMQKSYYRNIDIVKSIEKCFLNYWATELGWQNKIKTKP